MPHFQSYNRSSGTVSPTPGPRIIPHITSFRPFSTTFAKPFDRFKPVGGGASADIFRRFKIHKSEEEYFIVHWVRQPSSPGFLTRDANGALVFRVSSSDISGLSALGIGSADLDVGGVEWTHIYDEEGVSWLSRCRGIDYTASSLDVYDLSDEEWEKLIFANNGIIGRRGPSGLTPAEFHAELWRGER
ncbi:hypothetical protein K505DRAFT_329069 [Melanomma pulvis-pyrius CBS 109.77]|uniref:Uncharacterized protein n=1 Tax=Melanomma pulvis-pyrius CBS 109.77 TaxID=1314802 RepID=A0A6A6WWY4_9PLEO|nr:hypothetical protein K505DRAFT_329069 [Melanomma pulvis-pyrius CBS 109.77]